MGVVTECRWPADTDVVITDEEAMVTAEAALAGGTADAPTVVGPGWAPGCSPWWPWWPGWPGWPGCPGWPGWCGPGGRWDPGSAPGWVAESAPSGGAPCSPSGGAPTGDDRGPLGLLRWPGVADGADETGGCPLAGTPFREDEWGDRTVSCNKSHTIHNHSKAVTGPPVGA